ncbi:hypothetical protein CRUP_000138 [Coryphaenoides rupestris]|nr:hypothetical protein CRUP_000138 [Coryphaenoides rupestris]
MESGLMTVLEPLDRERTDRYFLNISVCDQGLPPMASWRMLTVVIEDANDNDPQFLQSRYSAVVSEDAAIGLEVLTVGAFDKDVGPNGQLSYTLLTDVPQFGVHRETGGVFVSAGLDREASPTFLLKVEARDQAERGAQRWAVATLSVTIGDVNDCAPVFVPASYSARVPEDFPPGAVVTWVQGQDPDLGLGGQVRYSLVNDFNGTFEVVDVSENLYAPSFSDFAVRGSVKENSRVGTSVAAAVATDRDAGRDGALRYAIAGGSSAFSIDEETAPPPPSQHLSSITAPPPLSQHLSSVTAPPPPSQHLLLHHSTSSSITAPLLCHSTSSSITAPPPPSQHLLLHHSTSPLSQHLLRHSTYSSSITAPPAS